MAMLCGMFGKLPSKRDFISYNMPRPFLEKWEEWLQSSVAASRHALATHWQDIFLTVPVWHYWAGARVFGTAATGALMPSVDGVGRYFPLTLCACEPEQEVLLSPPSPQTLQWHQQCADFLLHMLDDELSLEPSALLEQLPFAPLRPRGAVPQAAGRFLTWDDEPGSNLAAAFAGLDAMNNYDQHGDRSYWWTRGGGSHRARMVVVTGRAEPRLMASLMTGDFA
jgi:type VI secretion system protein ImpM